MKIHSFLIIPVLCCYSLLTLAQDWQCIKTDTEYYYGTSQSAITETIRIDSVFDISGYTYFQNRYQLRTFDYECYTPYGYSFLGQQVFSNDLVNWNFINNSGDTLKIKSDAILNESWLFYIQPASDIQIIAKIDSIAEYSFIDLVDSVKYISFQAQNLSKSNVSHSINSGKLILSKHYGFVNIFRFDQCPETFAELILLGIKNIQKGYVDFGAKEIWDMEIGDEFHEESDHDYHHEWNSSGSTTWYIRTVIDKILNSDSTITYKYLMQSHYNYWSEFNMNSVDTIYPPYISTVTSTRYNEFNTVPGGVFLDTSGYFKNAYHYQAGYTPSQFYYKKQRLSPYFKYNSDSCYLNADGGFPPHVEHSYWSIKGTGSGYNYSLETDGSSYASTYTFDLKYFKKGDHTWGTPFTFPAPPITAYQCIQPEKKVFYNILPDERTENGIVATESISIDSIYSANGMQYYINHLSMRKREGECYTPYGYSFLGKKVFSDSVGFWHFINNDGDTLHIKSNAANYEDWVFYKNELNDLKIIARIDSIKNISFSGIPDEVKYLSFKAYNLSGDSVSHPINDQVLLLSQDYGFVKLFRFDVCPMEISVMELTGENESGNGVSDVNSQGIFEMEPGDEFHEESFYQETKPAGTVYTRNQYIRKLISKAGSYDSIMNFSYDIQEHQVYYNSSTGYGQDTLFPNYTKEVAIDFNDPEITKWNSLPGEAYTDSISGYIVKLLSDNDYHSKSFIAEKQKINDSCYVVPEQIRDKSFYAVKGTGGLYHYYDDGYGVISRSDLKYFKKGNIVWGTPFDFSNLGEGEGIESIISVYPNPAEDKIVFSLNSPQYQGLTLEVYSSHGERIAAIQLEKNQKTEYNISGFRSGIYLYRIAGTNVSGTGKFIKL